MNNSNRWQYKYSTPNHQKISMEEIIDFLRKIFFAMLGKDDQQKGTDLREKRKTRLPFSPSPFWKPFNGNTQSPRCGSFIFEDSGDVTNPSGLSPCILHRKCKSSPMPPSRAKNWQQRSENPALFPRMSPWSTPPGWPLISA